MQMHGLIQLSCGRRFVDMGHFWNILLLLCVIITTRVTLGNLSRFVQLTLGDSTEQSIEVSGIIDTIESLNNTVNAEIRIRTRYSVKVAYCDPYSDIAVGEIVREVVEHTTETR